MATPKRVMCIMDMSGAGRSSMAVVLPVLSACGVQACPVPSVLYSTHHGGFGGVKKQDTINFCEDALSQYKAEGINFDAVYIGYLTSKSQFSFAWRAMRLYNKAFKVVDPVLGDNCKLYSQVNEDIVGMMKGLCGQADLITPNYTESALLLGENPIMKALDDTALKDRMTRLSTISGLAAKISSVLITSVPRPGGGSELIGCHPGGGNSFRTPINYVPQSYPGTGDLFTASLLGLMLQGSTMEIAAQQASGFVEACVRATYEGGGENRHGVWFEQCLSLLLPADSRHAPPMMGAHPF